MKKALLFNLLVVLSVGVLANDGKYETAMSDGLNELYSSRTIEDYQKAASKFERISAAEADKWHPSYYACLSYLWMVSNLQDKANMDDYLDAAQKNLDHCKNLIGEDDEIITLQGYIFMMRLVVDPPTRGAEYSPKAMQEFGKAVNMDPTNPRALLLLGQMQYGSADFFNADTSEPCATMKQAKDMLETEEINDPLAPAWGKHMAAYLLSNCE